MTQISRQESIQKLQDLIKDIDVAMLTTVDAEGTLRSRPMSTNFQDLDQGKIYFFADDESPKAKEIDREAKVNLSYAASKDQRYVSLSGSARVVHDRQKLEQFYTPAVKIWFPLGLDDPKLCLIEVTVENAEYWDSKGSKMQMLAGFVKSLVTGNPPVDIGENEKIEMTNHI